MAQHESGSLLFFFSESCPWTKRVNPEVEQLNVALRGAGKPTVVKLPVNVVDNVKLYEQVGGARDCGGVPFFYNQENKSSVCGFADAQVLKAWAGVE